MRMTTKETLLYYAKPGVMTDISLFSDELQDMPTQLNDIVRVVQGLLLHIFWAEREGEPLTKEREQEVNIRKAAHLLRRAFELDRAPLKQPRPLNKRVIGPCRDFSALTCAFLRYQNVPARARCGFATYFSPGMFEDHWVCEYWNAEQERWIMVDAQLNEFQKNELKIDFDTFDVPADRFLIAEKAWKLARAGVIDAEKCGIFDMRSFWFIRGDVGCDFAALNKVEILPWDGWGIFHKDEKDMTEADRKTIDSLADLMLEGDRALPRLRSLFTADELVRMPEDWEGLND